eukprot:ANDGO_04962.mRNA.1 hypothetical protein
MKARLAVFAKLEEQTLSPVLSYFVVYLPATSVLCYLCLSKRSFYIVDSNMRTKPFMCHYASLICVYLLQSDKTMLEFEFTDRPRIALQCNAHCRSRIVDDMRVNAAADGIMRLQKIPTVRLEKDTGLADSDMKEDVGFCVRVVDSLKSFATTTSQEDLQLSLILKSMGLTSSRIGSLGSMYSFVLPPGVVLQSQSQYSAIFALDSAQELSISVKLYPFGYKDSVLLSPMTPADAVRILASAIAEKEAGGKPFVVVSSSPYRKKMKLTNDPAAWITHRTVFHLDNECVVVFVCRRSYIAPDPLQYHDIVVVARVSNALKSGTNALPVTARTARALSSAKVPSQSQKFDCDAVIENGIRVAGKRVLRFSSTPLPAVGYFKRPLLGNHSAIDDLLLEKLDSQGSAVYYPVSQISRVVCQGPRLAFDMGNEEFSFVVECSQVQVVSNFLSSIGLAPVSVSNMDLFEESLVSGDHGVSLSTACSSLLFVPQKCTLEHFSDIVFSEGRLSSETVQSAVDSVQSMFDSCFFTPSNAHYDMFLIQSSLEMLDCDKSFLDWCEGRDTVWRIRPMLLSTSSPDENPEDEDEVVVDRVRLLVLSVVRTVENCRHPKYEGLTEKLGNLWDISNTEEDLFAIIHKIESDVDTPYFSHIFSETPNGSHDAKTAAGSLSAWCSRLASYISYVLLGGHDYPPILVDVVSLLKTPQISWSSNHFRLLTLVLYLLHLRSRNGVFDVPLQSFGMQFSLDAFLPEEFYLQPFVFSESILELLIRERVFSMPFFFRSSTSYVRFLNALLAQGRSSRSILAILSEFERASRDDPELRNEMIRLGSFEYLVRYLNVGEPCIGGHVLRTLGFLAHVSATVRQALCKSYIPDIFSRCISQFCTGDPVFSILAELVSSIAPEQVIRHFSEFQFFETLLPLLNGTSSLFSDLRPSFICCGFLFLARIQHHLCRTNTIVARQFSEELVRKGLFSAAFPWLRQHQAFLKNFKHSCFILRFSLLSLVLSCFASKSVRKFLSKFERSGEDTSHFVNVLFDLVRVSKDPCNVYLSLWLIYYSGFFDEAPSKLPGKNVRFTFADLKHVESLLPAARDETCQKLLEKLRKVSAN